MYITYEMNSCNVFNHQPDGREVRKRPLTLKQERDSADEFALKFIVAASEEPFSSYISQLSFQNEPYCFLMEKKLS